MRMTTTKGAPTTGLPGLLTNRAPSRFDPIEHLFDRTSEEGKEMGAPETTAAPAASTTHLRLVPSPPRPPRRGPGFTDIVAPPSTSQRRHCYLALEVARAALGVDSRDPWGAVPTALAAVKGAKQRAARPVVELHVRTLLMRMTERAELADGLLRQALADLSDSERHTQPQDCVRLFISSPPSAAATVLAYETHPARLNGGTRDLWMSRRIASHLIIGAHIPGFEGVIVSTPRCDAAATHTLPDRRTHALGRCNTCQDLAVRS